MVSQSVLNASVFTALCLLLYVIKGWFNQKKEKICHHSNNPYVVPTMCEFLSSVEHKIRYFEECH